MKIVINPNNSKPTDSWQKFRKVRAIIENSSGFFAIAKESEKILFPGGKCEVGESELSAIKREVLEETGINIEEKEFKKLFLLETMYEDVFDFRSNSIRPRHTITTYYYVKTNLAIDIQKQNLTANEVKENFKISFVDKQTLFELLCDDHSSAMNGKIFDEENKIVLKEFFNKY